MDVISAPRNTCIFLVVLIFSCIFRVAFVVIRMTIIIIVCIAIIIAIALMIVISVIVAVIAIVALAVVPCLTGT